MPSVLGICCTCQEAHPVHPSTKEFTDFDEEHDFEEDEFFVMDDHDPSFGGGRCEGTGTTPQAILREE